MNSRVVRVDVVGTGVFVVALAIAVPLRTERWAQVLIAVVSIALFAVGVGSSLWAYAAALERSRVQEVGVANLYLLTGTTAPPPVKRALLTALVVQVVASFSAASIGVVGLDDSQLNALAFAVLVPMFGIGSNGVWAARYGSYGPRVNPAAKPSNRKIGQP
ncbi:MAG: hypothetical protein K8R99_07445 [Actinomycetia bacterium]|nr:hypothetical protein [Actinomycetes bacterium]